MQTSAVLTETRKSMMFEKDQLESETQKLEEESKVCIYVAFTRIIVKGYSPNPLKQYFDEYGIAPNY